MTQTDSAIQEYTLANTLNPSDFRPDLYSSRPCCAPGRLPRRSSMPKSAVRDDPASGYLRGNLGYMLFKNFEWPASAEQFDLAMKGGLTDDGRTIQTVSLTDDDVWVVQYYYTYVVLLAQQDRCDEVLPLAQSLLDAFPSNEYAVYNANFAQEICAENLRSATAVTGGHGRPDLDPMKVDRRRALFYQRRSLERVPSLRPGHGDPGRHLAGDPAGYGAGPQPVLADPHPHPDDSIPMPWKAQALFETGALDAAIAGLPGMPPRSTRQCPDLGRAGPHPGLFLTPADQRQPAPGAPRARHLPPPARR